MQGLGLFSPEPMVGTPVQDTDAPGAINPVDRDLLIRTVIGEAAGEPVEGQAGVAHVVLNRLTGGGYGKNMQEVLFAPKQFEPWNTRRSELMSISPDSPQYQQAAAVVDGVLGGKIGDPTRGALNFANVDTVRARGNAAGMAWINDMTDNGSAVKIGRHTFGTPGSRPGRSGGSNPQSYEEGMAMRGASPLPADGFSPMRMPNVRSVDVTQAEPAAPLWEHFSLERTIPGRTPLANLPTLPGAIDPGYLYQDGPRPNPRGPLNPSLTAAAERGRGPAADRPARGAAAVESAPPAAPPPDLSNTNDAGMRALIAQQAGAPAMPQQRIGGLGGLGGFAPPAAPSSGGFDIGTMLQAIGMSLMTGDRRNPLKNFPTLFASLQAAADGRAKTAQEQSALSQALQMGGMSAQQAQTFAVNPQAAQIALQQFQQQRTKAQEATFMGQLSGGTPSGPASPGGAPAAPQDQAPAPAAPGGLRQPSQAGGELVPPAGPQPQVGASGASPSPAGASQDRGPVIDTGNRTVDALFKQRLGKVQEYEALSQRMAAAPTDRAKAAVESRLKAIEKQIGQVDKQIETYAPSTQVRDYTYAMGQRAQQGLPIIPFEKYDPAADRKQAQGPSFDDISGLRKEVQGLPSYKNVAQAAPVYKSMLDAAGRDDRASDVNLIYGMAKLMDPGSVVRESEMTVAQAIATLPQQLQSSIRSQLGQGGRLSQDVREGIMREAYSRMDAYRGMFDQDAGLYRGILQRRGIDEADVLPNFGAFKPYEPAPKPGRPGSGGGSSPPAPPPGLAPDPQYVRPDGSSPPMPSPPRAHTKAEWDKLAPGQLYIDATGGTRRKGGN